MLDEQNVSRLAEMGIDTWVLRSRVAARADAPAASPEPAQGRMESGGSPVFGARELSITIVGDVAPGADQRFLADLRRALRMAGVTSAVETRGAVAVSGAAIVFGAPQVSSAGAIDARDDRLHAADWPHLRRDPAAKRALWRDVVGLLHALAATGRKD